MKSRIKHADCADLLQCNRHSSGAPQLFILALVFILIFFVSFRETQIENKTGERSLILAANFVSNQECPPRLAFGPARLLNMRDCAPLSGENAKQRAPGENECTCEAKVSGSAVRGNSSTNSM